VEARVTTAVYSWSAKGSLTRGFPSITKVVLIGFRSLVLDLW